MSPVISAVVFTLEAIHEKFHKGLELNFIFGPYTHTCIAVDEQWNISLYSNKLFAEKNVYFLLGCSRNAMVWKIHITFIMMKIITINMVKFVDNVEKVYYELFVMLIMTIIIFLCNIYYPLNIWSGFIEKVPGIVSWCCNKINEASSSYKVFSTQVKQNDFNIM